MKRIYLDNNASTPMAPEVQVFMQKIFAEGLANPSSVHFFGQKARGRLIEARQKIADFFGVRPHELVFTSGGTEAINLLIRGTVEGLCKGTILTTNTEHPAVEVTLAALEKMGWQVMRVPVEQIHQSISENIKMIVVGAVNSETGVKAPVERLAAEAERNGIPLLVDGVAWVGKESITLHSGITGIAFSSHKIHGPKGVGLAITRKKVAPFLTGGPQENGRRGGTENLEGILGFAEAIELLKRELPTATHKMQQLRDLFESKLTQSCGAVVNGQGDRICNTSNLAFPGVDGETFLIHLDMMGIAASHGSACSSGSLEPSRVLLNMGLSPAQARSSIRFSLSRYTTEEEIESAVVAISSIVAQFQEFLLR